MTDLLREIEKGYEAKYKLDEEFHFKARCRRNKLFGLWATRQLGLAGDQAEAYTRALVRLDLEKPGHVDVADKVLADLAASGLKVGEGDVLVAFGHAAAEAFEQIADAYPTPLANDHVRVGD
jgi:hypothetical protein